MLSIDEMQRIEEKARDDNYRDGWGFNAESFWRLIMQHKYGDESSKVYVEERLTDANFHTPCALIVHGEYDAAMADFYDHARLPWVRGGEDVNIDELLTEIYGKAV